MQIVHTKTLRKKSPEPSSIFPVNGKTDQQMIPNHKPFLKRKYDQERNQNDTKGDNLIRDTSKKDQRNEVHVINLKEKQIPQDRGPLLAQDEDDEDEGVQINLYAKTREEIKKQLKNEEREKNPNQLLLETEKLSQNNKEKTNYYEKQDLIQKEQKMLNQQSQIQRKKYYDEPIIEFSNTKQDANQLESQSSLINQQKAKYLDQLERILPGTIKTVSSSQQNKSQDDVLSQKMLIIEAKKKQLQMTTFGGELNNFKIPLISQSIEIDNNGQDNPLLLALKHPKNKSNKKRTSLQTFNKNKRNSLPRLSRNKQKNKGKLSNSFGLFSIKESKSEDSADDSPHESQNRSYFVSSSIQNDNYSRHVRPSSVNSSPAHRVEEYEELFKNPQFPEKKEDKNKDSIKFIIKEQEKVNKSKANLQSNVILKTQDAENSPKSSSRQRVDSQESNQKQYPGTIINSSQFSALKSQSSNNKNQEISLKSLPISKQISPPQSSRQPKNISLIQSAISSQRKGMFDEIEQQKQQQLPQRKDNLAVIDLKPSKILSKEDNQNKSLKQEELKDGGSMQLNIINVYRQQEINSQPRLLAQKVEKRNDNLKNNNSAEQIGKGLFQIIPISKNTKLPVEVKSQEERTVPGQNSPFVQADNKMVTNDLNWDKITQSNYKQNPEQERNLSQINQERTNSTEGAYRNGSFKGEESKLVAYYAQQAKRNISANQKGSYLITSNPNLSHSLQGKKEDSSFSNGNYGDKFKQKLEMQAEKKQSLNSNISLTFQNKNATKKTANQFDEDSCDQRTRKESRCSSPSTVKSDKLYSSSSTTSITKASTEMSSPEKTTSSQAKNHSKKFPISTKPRNYLNKDENKPLANYGLLQKQIPPSFGLNDFKHCQSLPNQVDTSNDDIHKGKMKQNYVQQTIQADTISRETENLNNLINQLESKEINKFTDNTEPLQRKITNQEANNPTFSQSPDLQLNRGKKNDQQRDYSAKGTSNRNSHFFSVDLKKQPEGALKREILVKQVTQETQKKKPSKFNIQSKVKAYIESSHLNTNTEPDKDEYASENNMQTQSKPASSQFIQTQKQKANNYQSSIKPICIPQFEESQIQKLAVGSTTQSPHSSAEERNYFSKAKYPSSGDLMKDELGRRLSKGKTPGQIILSTTQQPQDKKMSPVEYLTWIQQQMQASRQLMADSLFKMRSHGSIKSFKDCEKVESNIVSQQ